MIVVLIILKMNFDRTYFNLGIAAPDDLVLRRKGQRLSHFFEDQNNLIYIGIAALEDNE